MGTSVTQAGRFECKANDLTTQIVGLLEQCREVRCVERALNRVTVKVRWSIWSVGEILDITVVQSSSHSCEMTVTSKSAIRFTLIDWGKNRRNVARILNALREQPAV